MSDQSPFARKVILRTPIDKPRPLTHNLGEALKKLKLKNPLQVDRENEAIKAPTKIENIAGRVTISSSITTVAIERPTVVDDVVRDHIQLGNLDKIQRKDPLIGDTAVVRQTNNSSPVIGEALKRKRTGREIFSLPGQCPQCRAWLVCPKGGLGYRCPNITCPAQLTENVERFISESGLNIIGLNSEMISRLAAAKIIQDPADLYNLKRENLISVGITQENTISCILNNIKESRKSQLEKIIFALGIDEMDEQSAEILSQRIVTIDDLIKFGLNKSSGIEGISPRVAENVKQFFFRQQDNEKFIRKLSKDIMQSLQVPRKHNWPKFEEILKRYKIKSLYHFTDATNLDSIKQYGLRSWRSCEDGGIEVSWPGGNSLSRTLDTRHELQNYVRLSFVKDLPMLYTVRKMGRVPNPVILEIDPVVIFWGSTLFSNINAADNDVIIGGDLEDFCRINFDIIAQGKRSPTWEKKFYQAEVMVETLVNINLIKFPIDTI